MSKFRLSPRDVLTPDALAMLQRIAEAGSFAAAGLEEITGGVIKIGGREVNHVPPNDRDVAMVFQNYALYPHMTVYATWPSA